MTRWRCHTCGVVLASWAASERHADEHHGARIEILLTEKRATS